MRVKFIFAWYDMWIGMYYSKYGRALYILPIPCLGICISFNRTRLDEIDLPGLHLGETFYGDQ